MSETGKHLEPVDSNARDTAYWEAVERIVTERGYRAKDLLRNFQAYAMRRDLSRFISHYELFKLVVDLPGSIVELGIYKGASFFAWAKLLDMFCSGTWDRLVYGFDRFDGLHGYTPEDGELGTHVAKREGGLSDTSFEEIETLAALHDVDGLMRGTRRCRIVAGDLMKTLPDFLDKNPETANQLAESRRRPLRADKTRARAAIPACRSRRRRLLRRIQPSYVARRNARRGRIFCGDRRKAHHPPSLVRAAPNRLHHQVAARRGPHPSTII